MPGSIRVGGTWREISQPSVRVGGVWRNVDQAWTRVSGVWREWFSATSMTLIASQTMTNNNTAVISFTSIPSTFRDLVIMIGGSGFQVQSGTGNPNLALRANNSSSTIYSMMDWRESAAGGTAVTAQTSAEIGRSAWNNGGASAGRYRITIYNYATASRAKQVFATGNPGIGNASHISASIIRTTTSVSSVQLLINWAGVANFASGTTVSLYGVKG
jgi:hypothetical protein